MVRLFRASLLTALALALALATAYGNIPDRDLSTVPDALTMSPDGSFEVVIIIEGQQGPVTGAYVEAEFSIEAGGHYGTCDGLIAWSVPIPLGADVPTQGPGGGYLFTGTTDPNGEVRFRFAAGGCVAQKVASEPVEPYIAQVRADNFVMNECVVNNPDVVNESGSLPEELQHSICSLDGYTEVGLSDALFHTPPIKQGSAEICTKFTGPYDAAVGLADATVLTPYVKEGTGWSCTYCGP